MPFNRLIDPHSIPFQREGIVFRKIDEVCVLVPMFSSSEDVDFIFNLNATGAEIWELINGKNTVAQIIETLKKEYDGPAKEIEEDVAEFLDELKDAGLIEFRNEER